MHPSETLQENKEVDSEPNHVKFAEYLTNRWYVDDVPKWSRRSTRKKNLRCGDGWSCLAYDQQTENNNKNVDFYCLRQ